MAHLSRNHIQNLDNYKNSFDDSAATIFTKYMILINEYLKHGEHNIYIQNPIYFNYVLKRGVSTLNYVFKILLIAFALKLSHEIFIHHIKTLDNYTAIEFLDMIFQRG